MKLASLCVILLLFCSVCGLSQEINQIFGVRQTFAETESTVMTKVIVCLEDQSVWALSAAGEVYYKAGAGTVFNMYANTGGLVVTDLAGYNANEMYFVAGGKLYKSENMGALSEIVIPGVIPSPVNNIAVVNASRNIYLQGYLPGKRDWLAVATNSRVESLLRDNGLFELPYTPTSTGSAPECRITNGGFKSLDFQYKNPPSNQCFGPVEHVYFNKVGTADTETILPDSGPEYEGRVNCTYFEASFNSVKDGNNGFDYWGTDKGLFVKTAGSCGPAELRNVVPDVKINDLEELNFFRDFFNDKIVLAAGADGLYLGTKASFPVDAPELDRIGFNKLYNFDTPVNGIAVEINGAEGLINGENKVLCQKAVWLATDEGIIKIPLNPASKSISKDISGKNGYLVSVDAGLKDYYCVTNGEEYKFTAHLPNNDLVNYQIQWLRDPERYVNREVIESLTGQTQVTFTERGEYGARITSMCDGEFIDIGGFWLREPERISTDFDYPDIVTIFKGCTFEFTAAPGNQYKWERNGVFLAETSNVLEATEPGIYRLFYYDGCSETYEPLSPVELKEIDVAQPVITRSKNLSLCFGEKVTLSVADPGIEGVTYKWQRNGVEIVGETSQTLETDQPGNYDLTLVLGDCSGSRSATAVVEINEELKLDPPAQVQICTIRDQHLKLTAPEGFATYTWDGVAGTANVLEITAPGEYMLEVEDASGCKANTSYIVVPYCAPALPPNAFSPNGDGINDLWTVGGLDDDPNAKISIYNRYGVSVFEGSVHQPSWNGKLKGKDVPEGTYYYVITKKTARPLTGSLVLIR